MWFTPEVRRLLAYSKPVDLRKSINGLVGLVKSVLAEDPLSGSVFVFLNRRGNYLKLVGWDRTGYCLFAKRLERGRFRLPGDAPTQELSVQVFQLLLDGIELGWRTPVGYTAGMTLEEHAAVLQPDESVGLLLENADLRRQVEWFKRQLFGRKSERRLRAPAPQQLSLAGRMSAPPSLVEAPPPPTETVTAYQRRTRWSSLTDASDEGGLRFAPSVPVQDIVLANPEVAALPPDAYEVIGEKVTYRLAQRPGAYVVLKYVRPVIKRKDTDTVSCPPAPPAVFEKSGADVSLLAGLLIDKFCFHLPLYRQHQRLLQAGIRLSRATLTQWVHRTAALLEPIYYALLSSILQSQGLTMDETPLKAGRREKGKLHTGYFWPGYGDQDEIASPFAASRAGAVVREALGQFCGILLTEGYRVYDRFAHTVNGLVHAQCWSPTRRHFVDAEQVEPVLVRQALERIGTLYEHEAHMRQHGLEAETKLAYRGEYGKPVAERFFAWLSETLRTQPLLPSNPFAQAARYALAREAALNVFLTYPHVPLDTNPLEREIRAIALGRKNWLSC